MIILLLPTLFFIFIVGWCMYWIGGQKKPDKKQPKPLKKDNARDNVTIMPIVNEETQEIVNE